jgi:hypothetical protein
MPCRSPFDFGQLAANPGGRQTGMKTSLPQPRVALGRAPLRRSGGHKVHRTFCLAALTLKFP